MAETVSFHLRIPRDIWQWLRDQATAEERDMCVVLLRALRYTMDEWGAMDRLREKLREKP